MVLQQDVIEFKGKAFTQSVMNLKICEADHLKWSFIFLAIKGDRFMTSPVRRRPAVKLPRKWVSSQNFEDKSDREQDPVEENPEDDSGVDPSQNEGKCHPPKIDRSEERLCDESREEEHE